MDDCRLIVNYSRSSAAEKDGVRGTPYRLSPMPCPWISSAVIHSQAALVGL
jgi:hypothetical protein